MGPETSSSDRLVLASGSPRRRELMKALDLPVEWVVPDGDEGSPRAGESPREFVMRLSLEKARQGGGRSSDAVTVGADTAVVAGNEVLGKPANPDEAAQILWLLRGGVHAVVTGVTALDGRSGRWLSASKSTEVRMRHYSDQAIAAYVASGEPMDKAGAYAVQDERFRPAQEVHGCYLNVVGLPLCELVDLLAGLGMHRQLRRDWELPEECRNCPLERVKEVPQE